MRQRLRRREMGSARSTAIAVAISVVTVTAPLLLREGKAEEAAPRQYLSFFADDRDARILLDRLNADPEIAFIVPDGPRLPPPKELMPPLPAPGAGQRLVVVESSFCRADGYYQRWRAVRPVASLNDGEYVLWHIAAGPLVRDDGPQSELQPIPDPWTGWTSPRPLCGPNILAAATIRLRLQTRYAAYTAEEQAAVRPLISYWINRNLLVASDFQWPGGSLLPDGYLKTAKWAADLKDWFSRNAVELHAREGGEVFWAFPSALQRLKAGLRYDARNYNLDDAIRDAR